MLASARVGAGRRRAGRLVARHFGSTALVSRGVWHDNRPALAFYRKPQIPARPPAGIPIEDEFLIGQRPHVRD